MPFIWNDKTYWERYKKSFSIFKLFIPIYILSASIVFILFEVKINEIFLLALVSSLSIITFIDIFMQTLSPGIPDSYSKWGSNIMYIMYFLVSTSVALYIFYKVL